jgi:hypothetical protein
MQVKSVKPINFLSFCDKLEQIDITGNLRNMSMALHLEAAKRGFSVTGPLYVDHLENRHLEVAIPVGELFGVPSGQFQFRRSTEFKCLSFVHSGSRDRLDEVRYKLRKYIDHHQLGPSTFWREIYINTDFDTPDANVTEIQLEITNK